MRPLTVVLAEDSPIVRAGLARLLRDIDVDVAGEADDVQSMMRTVESTHPDAVVMDMRMPPSQTAEGLEGATALRSKFPAVAVLLLSQHAGSPAALDFIERSKGGVGYLLKDRVADATVLADALRRLVAGGTVIDAGLAERLVESKRQAAVLATATVRERQVLALMAEGLSNAAIAERLVLAEKTVELHVSKVLKELGLPVDADANRRVLAVLAYLRASGRMQD